MKNTTKNGSDIRAIVIGATGVVGRELVKILSADNRISEVVTFTRREYEFNSSKVINYIIDFDNIEKYSDLVEGEFLFSCLGTTKSQAGSISNQRKVDLEYQYEFAKIAQRNGVHHYFLVSSPGASSTSSSAYLKMKGELEELVHQLDFASISILKPSLIDGTRADFRFFEKCTIILSSCIQFLPWLKKYRKIKGLEIAMKMFFEAFNNPSGKKEYVLDELFDIGDI